MKQENGNGVGGDRRSQQQQQQAAPLCKGLTEEQVAAITRAVDEILPQLPEFTVKKGRMKKIGNKQALVSTILYYFGQT